MSLIVPFSIPLVAVLLSPLAEASKANSLLFLLSIVVALFSVILSMWYQQSNAFFGLVLMLICQILLNDARMEPVVLQRMVNAVSLILPLTLLGLSFSQERGIVSSYGLNKAALVFMEGIWLWLVPRIGAEGAGQPLNDTTPFFAPGIAAFVICLCVMLAGWYLKRRSEDLALVALLLSLYVQLHFAARELTFYLFSTATFLIYLVMLLEVSYAMAFRDTLTGVSSRRAMDQELLKLGNQYILAMVDIDHFKKINDTYGHDAGDDVLRMIATQIERHSGKGKVFRYGGEEFAILYTGVNTDDAMASLEKLRQSIERRPFYLRGPGRPKEKVLPDEKRKPLQQQMRQERSPETIQRVDVTVSIGCAVKAELHHYPAEVLKQADVALYHAKQNGRNRVQLSETM